MPQPSDHAYIFKSIKDKIKRVFQLVYLSFLTASLGRHWKASQGNTWHMVDMARERGAKEEQKGSPLAGNLAQYPDQESEITE